MNESFEKAIKIFYEIISSKGKINKTKESMDLFLWMYDEDVKKYLNKLEEINGIKIFQHNDTIYGYAKEKSLFCYKESDLKNSKIQTNAQVYLMHIIFFCFLSEMYSGDTQLKIIRNSISVEELQESVTNFLVKPIEKEKELESGINFSSAYEIWSNLPSEADKELSPSTKSKPEFILQSMMFWKSDDVGLVSYNKDLNTYIPTKKLEDFIAHGELNLERFNQLVALKERGE